MLLGIPIAVILKISFIDICLSGDNAVVIAMAARSLPGNQQRRAILYGGAAAILLRVTVTALVAWALRVPLLQLGGGLLLCWIAVKLLRGGEEEKDVKAGTTLGEAVATIVTADFVMSLDNMLAVGGASEGNVSLLLMGLLLSMAIIMFCSSLIARLMNRLPWLVYIGAGTLGYTAGEMILRDRWLHRFYVPSTTVQWLFPSITIGLVITLGYYLNHRAPAHRET